MFKDIRVPCGVQQYDISILKEHLGKFRVATLRRGAQNLRFYVQSYTRSPFLPLFVPTCSVW